jgi:hypothetical protein
MADFAIFTTNALLMVLILFGVVAAIDIAVWAVRISIRKLFAVLRGHND